jgi:cation diffusion facilitator family transporter
MTPSHPLRSEADLETGLNFSVLSVATNGGMGVLKFGVGLFSGSQALMAGALYSINDVLASIAVNVSLRLSSRDPTERHPWGWERAEHLATAFTGTVLAIAVTGVFLYQFKDLITLHTAPPHITALGVAVLSIFVSGFLFRRAHHLSHVLVSPALHTTAEHSKADAISSVAVIIGIGAASIGLHIIDRLVAVFEIGHIVFLAGELMVAASRGLMDISLPEEDVSLVREACQKVPGIERVPVIRTRKGGRSSWVDVVVDVAGGLSVRDAHAIAARARRAVLGVLGSNVEIQVKFRSATEQTLD